MIRDLIKSEDPLLHKRIDSCSYNLDRQFLSKTLIESMMYHNGVGLSANQIGISERAFVMIRDIEYNEIIVCFNPKIINQSEEEILMDEGCLSWPGLWLKVRRPEGIEVTYEDAKGELHEKAMFGLEARIFQHEYDHMEGTDFTKRVSKLKLDLAKKRLRKVQKKLDRVVVA